jgi:hypothetical protein
MRIRARAQRERRRDRMTNFDDMTAMVLTAQARTATGVRKGAMWNRFALPDIEQHCGRSFAPGGA